MAERGGAGTYSKAGRRAKTKGGWLNFMLLHL